jgi:hypothetical protein
MENRPRRHIHIFWPLLLIAVGVFLFLNNMDILPGTTMDILLKLWPILFILGGVEGFINREGYLWPILITGLGVLFLLSNFGQLPIPVWTSILRLWPVLLIALGLNLLIGRSKGWLSPVLGILVGLLLVGSVYLLAVNSSALGNPHSEQIEIPAAHVEEASGSIVMPVGRLILSGGETGDLLVAGNATLSKGEVLHKPFSDSRDPGDFSINSSGANYVFSLDSGTYTWDLQMNQDVPFTSLDTQVYTGEISADLSLIKLEDFDFELPVGKLTVALPNSPAFNGTLDVAVGQVIVCVPPGMALRIHLEPAVTVVNLDKEFSRDGNTITPVEGLRTGETVSELSIKLPVGIISIHSTFDCDLGK